jgi:excinuclease ABC subunit C
MLAIFKQERGEHNMDLKEKIKVLPSVPGVYLMKDSLGGIIYVGKSKNLKSRVGSYFQNSKAHSPKVVKLVKNIQDFDYILTDTEFEAFLLECRLIKELKPRYNRMMKSPLSYIYIKIDMKKEYKSFEVVNQKEESDGCLYFGPYTNKNTVGRAVEGIKQSCKILCSNPTLNCSSCLYYSLGSCLGVYEDESAKDQYNTVIGRIINLLNGKDKTILQEMEQTMQSAAENFNFETAARYRDYISATSSLFSQNKIIDFTKESKNIAMLEHLDDNLIKFFLIKGSSVIFNEKYYKKIFDLQDLKVILKRTILEYFNISDSPSLENIGKNEIDEAQIIYNYLKKNNCSYIVIPEQWLKPDGADNLAKALDNLLCFSN